MMTYEKGTGLLSFEDFRASGEAHHSSVGCFFPCSSTAHRPSRRGPSLKDPVAQDENCPFPRCTDWLL